MHRTLFRGLIWMMFIAPGVSVQGQSRPSESSSIVEKNLTFASPVQWRTGAAEISLIHVAWGPADSPELLSRGRQKILQEQPTFYPDRPYVLALGFKATSASVIPTTSYSTSGLVRVKDTNGNFEPPMVLTPEGFVPFSGSPGVYDVHFDKGTTAEYWDLFPVAPDQKEFLFQVFLGNVQANNPRLSFRIVLRDTDVSIVDVSPQLETTCLDFDNDFAGKVGASARVKIHLVGKNTNLAGTEQYERIGKTLRLRGSVDSLGNSVMEERYPESDITGIFKGKFSGGCQVIQGYFSKPDGSRLLPFEFHQVRSAGDEPQVPDQHRSQN